MNTQPITQLMDALPTDGLTVRSLQVLDFVAPGQWTNVVGFDNMIRVVTGESDPGFISQVRNRAVQLYNDESQGYQRAVWIYQLVDSTDSKLGMAAMANKIGESISFLSFLSKITPRADTAQTIDFSVKIIAELVAYCYANGFPGDGIGDFVNALGSYEKDNLIRMSAIMAYDGLIPLGPDFARILVNKIDGFSPSDLEQNSTFQRIKQFLPNSSGNEALQFVGNGIHAMSGQLLDFSGRYGITPNNVTGKLRTFIDFSDDKLDYLAGFLDMSTNYMEHTGIQSVSRSLISRAAGEI